MDLAAGAGVFVEQKGRQAAAGGDRGGGEAGRAGADDGDVVVIVDSGIRPHLPASRRDFCVSMRMPSATSIRQPWRLPTPSMVTRHSKHTPIMQ